MAIVYEKSRGLTDVEFHYCPGCHHGIIHKLVAESLVELGLLDDAIGVCPVGSIGAAEIVHAAMRGEKFTTIFVNNAIYGMTGGQMAPTTLIGQKATTCQEGRTREQAGMPIRMAEMLSTLDGCAYAERVCVTDIANINKAKKAIKKAFQKQMNGEGFTFIEVLSTCPTNWGMTPLKANQWLKDNMVPYYPLGVIKETAPEGAEVK